MVLNCIVKIVFLALVLNFIYVGRRQRRMQQTYNSRVSNYAVTE